MDAEVDDLGPTPAGHRRIVRVTGGAFEGPKLKGAVLPGGGDWVLQRGDGTRALDVRIALRTDDGHLIYVHCPGRFNGAPDVLQRITRGSAGHRTRPPSESPGRLYGVRNSLTIATARVRGCQRYNAFIWGSG